MAILVFGSINEDVIIPLERRPAAGETVLGSEVTLGQGGKGANQAAAAAAAAGVEVRMVGAVGADGAGNRALQALTVAGVETDLVATLEDARTGTAYVHVTPDGENSIVVVPGANHAVDGTLLGQLQPALSASDVVIVQTEIGSAGADAAAELASGNGARLVLNAAPVIPLTRETYSACDPLVVNEHEARDIAGIDPFVQDPTILAEAVRRVSGARSVVVTLGAKGCIVFDANKQYLVPGESARVVDTTGAGDVFVGTLAARLALGDQLERAATSANAAGARAVTWQGAREVIPAHATSRGSTC
ncbi:ribokinase [Arthrobacter sp. B2a2-09]|uniref:ribokinase n=1 Tax=Arthrobacter sp. B2a2-09 TaxID=2952822 RepID=UPI0022CD7182|nr:ribokinase [Arthrobacter sp. B2a2-09]MCZ9882824.1 ribokinase [Arthrobacter sp. B2a2-09]